MSTDQDTTYEERLKSGLCVGCGGADYTQVCDRGTPKHGKPGLYCQGCFDSEDED